MKTYIRMTKLKATSGGVSGRADYISNPDRQQKDGIEILAASPPVDWQPYEDFEKSNQHRTTGDIVSGRELMIPIPDHWQHSRSRTQLYEDCKNLVETAIGKSTDYQFAVHFGAKGSVKKTGEIRDNDNLHIHVVFSERTKVYEFGEKERYSRNLFRGLDGKVTKSAKTVLEDGTVVKHELMHRKGDLKGFVSVDEGGRQFTLSAKNKQYTGEKCPETGKISTDFLEQAHTRLSIGFQFLGEKIDKPNEVKHVHVGRGKGADERRAVNDQIRIFNERAAELPRWDNSAPPQLRQVRKLTADKVREFLYKRLPVEQLRIFIAGAFKPKSRPDAAESMAGVDRQATAAAAVVSKPLQNQQKTQNAVENWKTPEIPDPEFLPEGALPDRREERLSAIEQRLQEIENEISSRLASGKIGVSAFKEAIKPYEQEREALRKERRQLRQELGYTKPPSKGMVR